MWRRRTGLLGLALSLVLVVSLVAPVSAIPLPHSFYGTLEIGGLPAPVGTEVTAWVDTDGDDIVDTIGGSIITTEEGKYGDSGPADPKLSVSGDFETGDLIEFHVNGAKADETAEFRSGRTDELNLTVPGVMYDLAVASTPGGSVTDPGEDTFTYVEGTVVDLLAEPDSCYEFVNWTGDVGTVADVNAASTTITMDGDYSIIANFAPTQYDLTVASTPGGSVTDPGEATFTYDCGQVVNLLAEPDSCYVFVNWTGDVGTIADVNAASTTITMDGDYSIMANFAPIQYDLTVASSADGSVTDPGEATFTYDCGQVVNLLAVPDTGYEFVNWTGDVGTIADVNAASTTITMNGDYSIMANFALTAYDLTVSSSAGGSVTDPGEATFTYGDGEVVDLVAEPDSCYVFVNWTGDVGTIADVNAASTTITMDGDYSITANFAPGVSKVRLCPGWNAISTPIALDPSMDTWGEFSAGLDVDPGAITYYFDGLNQMWGQVLADYQIKPCDAIYVKMLSHDLVVIVPSPDPSVSTKQLYAGWNLVGLAYIPMGGDGLPGMKANSALVSVKEVSGGLTGYSVVISPPLCQRPWIYTNGAIGDWDGVPPAPDGWMVIGKGYWVFMLNDGTLAGFTFTPLGSN
jgi:hypothetical protein